MKREKERKREDTRSASLTRRRSDSTRHEQDHHAPATIAHALYLSLLLSLLRFCIVTAVTRLACLYRSLQAAKHTRRHGKIQARVINRRWLVSRKSNDLRDL